MPPDAHSREPVPFPWAEFLAELDTLIGGPIELRCIGGFVLTALYGMPRPTADVDYVSALPFSRINELQAVAGRESPLAKKHKVYLQYVAVVTLPENHETRLEEMFPGRFRNLRLFALDPYDLVLSKLERNSQKDREDVEYLAKSVPLSCEVLRDRYERELRPYLSRERWHDQTLELWLEAYFR